MPKNNSDSNPGFWKGYVYGFLTVPVVGTVLALLGAAVGALAATAANRKDEIQAPEE